MKIKLKKGLNLDLAGSVESLDARRAEAKRVAITPDDFPGFVPKLEVKEGDAVMAGQPLLRDKNYENVKIVAPCAGTVREVVRGERRKIERVVIEAAPGQAVSLDSKSLEPIELLARSGMLTRMRQRPYDIVPRPDKRPRDIFVTAIDQDPLSPGLAWMVAGKAEELRQGVALLSKVTDGKVYLSVGDDWTLGDIAGAEMVEVEGKHPAGNAGVQAANIKPVNKGETIWTLDVVTLSKIGQLALTGSIDCQTRVAITGSEVEHPCIVETAEGAELKPLLEGNVKPESHHVRIISGNVLTGTAESIDLYLRFPYRQITVIPDGDDVDEFMGWASLSPKKMSTSPSFLGHFFGHKFAPDARLKGGRRAMIMSGQYDKYVPMDILPEYLIKAILAHDINGMEQLGIYEVAPEDFALAEYADTSKLPLQQIVRDGLDYLRKELE